MFQFGNIGLEGEMRVAVIPRLNLKYGVEDQESVNFTFFQDASGAKCVVLNISMDFANHTQFGTNYITSLELELKPIKLLPDFYHCKPFLKSIINFS